MYRWSNGIVRRRALFSIQYCPTYKTSIIFWRGVWSYSIYSQDCNWPTMEIWPWDKISIYCNFSGWFEQSCNSKGLSVLNLLCMCSTFSPKFWKILACFSFNCTYHCVVNLLAKKEEKTMSVTNIIMKMAFIVTKRRSPASWEGSHYIITNHEVWKSESVVWNQSTN